MNSIFQSDYMAKQVVVGNFDQSVRNLVHGILGPGLALDYTIKGIGEGKKDLESTKMWDVILGKLFTCNSLRSMNCACSSSSACCLA